MSDAQAMEIQRTLGRLETKIDGLTENLEVLHERADSHATRITELETWKTRSTAFFAGVTAVVSIVGAGVYHLLFLAKH